MIKNLPITDLKPGMQVVDTGVSWTIRPYLYAANRRIESEEDIQDILKQGYTEVYVDFVRSETPSPPPALSDIPLATSRQPSVSLQEELPVAQAIHNQSVAYAHKFMEDIRSGSIDMAPASAVVDNIVHSLERNADALLSLGRLRRVDTYTHMHCVNVSILTSMFARYRGASPGDIHIAGLTGLFHDLGKALVPLDILNAPRKLTPEEFSTMQKHPLFGYQQLCEISAMQEAVLKGAVEHHEKHDGSGYPYGLAGDDISDVGRMVGISDVYDALSSERVYKKGLSAHKTLSILYQLSNKEFEASAVALFIRMMGIFPVGSIVELEDNWMGVVSASNQESPAKPTVRLVLDPKGRGVPPQDKNLAAGEGAPIAKCLSEFPGINPARILGLGET